MNNIDSNKIVFIKKKTISFNEKVDVKIIPIITTIKVIKKVSFNRKVIVFPIPRKEDLSSVSNDLWYSRDELVKNIFDYDVNVALKKKEFKKLIGSNS